MSLARKILPLCMEKNDVTRSNALKTLQLFPIVIRKFRLLFQDSAV